MLRILKQDKEGDLKAVSKKEQDKICAESEQNVGRPLDLKPGPVRDPYPGLKQAKAKPEKGNASSK